MIPCAAQDCDLPVLHKFYQAKDVASLSRFFKQRVGCLTVTNVSAEHYFAALKDNTTISGLCMVDLYFSSAAGLDTVSEHVRSIKICSVEVGDVLRTLSSIQKANRAFEISIKPLDCAKLCEPLKPGELKIVASELDFSSQFITDSEILCKLLETDKNFTILNLENCGFRQSHAEVAGVLLGSLLKNSSITNLNMKGIWLGSQHFDGIVALMQQNCHIQKLSISVETPCVPNVFQAIHSNTSIHDFSLDTTLLDQSILDSMDMFLSKQLSLSEFTFTAADTSFSGLRTKLSKKFGKSNYKLKLQHAVSGIPNNIKSTCREFGSYYNRCSDEQKAIKAKRIQLDFRLQATNMNSNQLHSLLTQFNCFLENPTSVSTETLSSMLATAFQCNQLADINALRIGKLNILDVAKLIAVVRHNRSLNRIEFEFADDFKTKVIESPQAKLCLIELANALTENSTLQRLVMTGTEHLHSELREMVINFAEKSEEHI
jgi:hypothetical protein